MTRAQASCERCAPTRRNLRTEAPLSARVGRERCANVHTPVDRPNTLCLQRLWALRDSNPRPPPCKHSNRERCATCRRPPHRRVRRERNDASYRVSRCGRQARPHKCGLILAPGASEPALWGSPSLRPRLRGDRANLLTRHSLPRTSIRQVRLAVRPASPLRSFQPQIALRPPSCRSSRAMQRSFRRRQPRRRQRRAP